MGIEPGLPRPQGDELAQRPGAGGGATGHRAAGQADLDLRGRKDLAEEVVMEVLVAQFRLLVALSRMRASIKAGGRAS